MKASFADVISRSLSSSRTAGRAFSAGNDPTIPAVHCAITSCGLDTMNIGAPITGSARSFARSGGRLIGLFAVNPSQNIVYALSVALGFFAGRSGEVMGLAVNAPGQVLHAAVALIALYLGFFRHRDTGNGRLA